MGRIKWDTMRLKYYDDRRYVKISDKAREFLSKPLGLLYTQENLEDLRNRLIEVKRSRKLISSVGDRVTKTLIDWGVTPDIAVIDCMERRRPVNLVSDKPFKTVVYIDNRRGMVNLSIIDIVKENLDKTPLLIRIGGEDDLVGIPIILSLREGDIVIYGQPKQGIVHVEVTSKLKDRLRQLIL